MRGTTRERSISKLLENIHSYPALSLQKESGISYKNKTENVAFLLYRTSMNNKILSKLVPGYIPVDPLKYVSERVDEDRMLDYFASKEEIATMLKTSPVKTSPVSNHLNHISPKPITEKMEIEDPDFTNLNPLFHFDPSIYKRNPLSSGFENEEFMVVDVDLVYEQNLYMNNPYSNYILPVFRIFGCTKSRASICVRVCNFLPYFYIRASSVKEDEESLRERINAILTEEKLKTLKDPHKFSKSEDLCLYVLSQNLKSVYGYTQEPPEPFYKVGLSRSKYIYNLKNYYKPNQLYNYSLNPVIQFMVDKGIKGSCWLKVDLYQIPSNLTSNCQIELVIDHNNLSICQDSSLTNFIAPIRTLSFDIEVKSHSGSFPKPENEKDIVIQIANVVTEFGNKEPIYQTVFSLGSSFQLATGKVYELKTEKELLLAWKEYVRAVDPDIITGYNIRDFDLPFLFKKAESLFLSDYGLNFGKDLRCTSKLSTSTFNNKAHGKTETSKLNTPGRVIIDTLITFKRDHKLRSYTLNSVSAEFLKDQKDDMDHTLITPLWRGSKEDRTKLCKYCLKDALLPLKLIEKMCKTIQQIELSRICGIPLDYIQNKGQQIKVLV